MILYVAKITNYRLRLFKMTTIRDLIGIPAVQVYTHNRAVPIPSADPSLLYGVELEIEKVPNWDGMHVTGISSVEDGSLRDSGREFITKPMTFSFLSYVLRLFFNKNKLGEANYSERTSVHIHANCQDLTVEQLGTICLLYQCFEPLLYRWIGGDRDKNIFCVPWGHSNLSYDMVHSLVEKKDLLAVRRWMKYSGLNLLPLYTQGTIEFRHMGGTCDVERILEWAGIIGSLFAHARVISLDDTKKWILGLNTTSAYGISLDSIFKQYAFTLRYPGYEVDLEEGVLGVKYSLSSSKKKSYTASSAPGDLAGVLAQLQEADRERARIREETRQRATAEARGAVQARPFAARAFDDILAGGQNNQEQARALTGEVRIAPAPRLAGGDLLDANAPWPGPRVQQPAARPGERLMHQWDDDNRVWIRAN
jgi:hypothetical protein